MSRLLEKLNELTYGLPAQLAGLAFPPECVLCQSPVATSTRLCAECQPQLVSARSTCLRCAMPVPSVLTNESCSRCSDQRWHFSRVISLGIYQGKLREAVILCKKIRYEHMRYALAVELVQRLQQRLPDLATQQPLLVPVPNHWSRAFARTASTANSLAELIARLTSWPVTTGMIRRVRKTSKQGMLSLAERQQNVRGAFELRGSPSLIGRHLLIVDDVLTSGSTAQEVAKQLRRCQPAEISVLTIARATGT